MASPAALRWFFFWKRQKDKLPPWDDKERWRLLKKSVDLKAKTENSPIKKNYVDSWHRQMENAGQASDRFKNWYYVSATLTAVATATVPTLIAFTGSTDAFTAKVLRIVAAALGVLVAGVITLLGVVEVGNRWRLYRGYVQMLEEAGRAYLADNKEDDKDDRKYNKFVTDVDQAFKDFGRAYMKQVAVLRQAPPGNGDQAGADASGAGVGDGLRSGRPDT